MYDLADCVHRGMMCYPCLLRRVLAPSALPMYIYIYTCVFVTICIYVYAYVHVRIYVNLFVHVYACDVI